MQFTVASVLSVLAATAAALPASSNSSAIPDGTKFNLLSLRSASPVHFAYFQAAHRGLLVKLPEQGANCTGGNDISNNLATFYIKDKGLYLYGPDGCETQQIFTDLSGMGQGVIQYTTGDQGLPRNAQRGPFTIDADGNLRVADFGFVACPSFNQSYSIRAGGGGSDDCLGISARVVPAADPGACVYSQE
ncbi:hypothetical protein MCOR27_000905 [Pyricularia oryzae]|uniref:Cell wall protein PhiA n=5 Tax=Pyricularia TaxID=48558 RepID=A0ABQ8NVH0_PYRGI|nr:uncharacterized protein MGG_00081 [Pyricularia oryzae 70-15]ELQ44577.1 hypothetical protein OOU_Y34scaffold00073g12 [Pyricularia oryzae Y34]KAH8841404.1 hypothetical protein MCOR01_008070 [Pyricularia oryzae]KAI6302173.1 hypothetical protein MCOR33_002489 [Pyricularia grisea]EHA49473.1 hypothetical protein MGG_00081 [Pyricularia oryzae 70-15]KAH9433251.1 hypothetical protein MCOR02_005306 [Pyricularia oryzae]